MSKRVTIRPIIDEIAAERRRQMTGEGWTPDHDDKHTDGSLAKAAACYALGDATPHGYVETPRGTFAGRLFLWPWGRDSWKAKSTRRNLIRAAALIVAEIERLDSAAGVDGEGA